MSYIRTKDGRIISYNKNANKIDLPMILNYPNQILNQSDNLDELCDEFVLYDNQFNTYGVFDKKVITFKWLKEHFGLYDKGMTLYGAIWTSKGLIFVAKMNEKGELVLI